MTYIFFSLAFSVVQLLVEPGFLVTFLTINSGNAILAAAFWLNRRGYLQLATYTSLGTLSATILLSVLAGPGGVNAHNLYVVCLPIVLGSVFMTIKGLVILSGLNTAGMVLVSVFTPGVTLAAVMPPILFVLTISAFLLVFLHHRDGLEKDRQDELKATEARYRELVENINDVIYSLDKKGYFTYVSPVVERLTRYKTEEMVGKHFSKFVVPGDLAALKDNLGKVSDTPGSAIDFRFIDKDGQILYARTSAQRVVRQGKTIGITGQVTDITEQRKLEEKLRQAHKMESVGRLAGGIAHEFNNLLTVILGYCEMITEDLEHGTAGSNSLGPIKGINTATKRAASLIRQLLTFSRKQTARPKRLNIGPWLDRLKDMLRPLIGEHIDIHLRCRPGVNAISVDPGQLEQVMINLAINASDAMPREGKITVEAANVYLDKAYCRQHDDVEPGDYVMLAISDTGSGFDKRIANNIFDPFFTTKKPGKGAGLGLSAVYGIVKQNKGHIWFASEVNEGTTFKMHFPVATGPDQPEAEKHEKVNPTDTRGAEKLLVVEDEAGLRDVMVLSLEGYGYKVFAAANGIEAIKLWQKLSDEKLDMLITDIVMPGMGGKELAEELSGQYPDIKVLYISGYTETTIENHGIQVEGVSFLSKPFSPILLSQRVREMLDVKG
ncbi:MAG: PAS domain S-box protein [bacterium]|nr:PAS domain S-box protein [bacterium]